MPFTVSLMGHNNQHRHVNGKILNSFISFDFHELTLSVGGLSFIQGYEFQLYHKHHAFDCKVYI